jgi:hypothetical protein
VDVPCIDFVTVTVAYNWEPYLALMLVTATEDELAAGDTSVGLGPKTGNHALNSANFGAKVGPLSSEPRFLRQAARPPVSLECAVQAACKNGGNTLGYTRYPMSPWS